MCIRDSCKTGKNIVAASNKIKPMVTAANICAGNLSLFKPDKAASPLNKIAKQVNIGATIECKTRADKTAPTKKTGAKKPSVVRDVSIPSQPRQYGWR